MKVTRMDSKVIASYMIKDFLVHHGLKETLATFEKELESSCKAQVPGLQTWYQISRAMDYPSMQEYVKFSQEYAARAGEGDGFSVVGFGAKGKQKLGSSLEVSMQYLCDAHTAKLRPPLVVQECKQQELPRSTMVAPSTAGSGKTRETKISQKTGGNVEEEETVQEMSVLDRALAMEHVHDDRDLYSVALETQLNSTRFHPVTGELVKCPNPPVRVDFGVKRLSGDTISKEIRKNTATGRESVNDLTKRLAGGYKRNEAQKGRQKKRTLKPLRSGQTLKSIEDDAHSICTTATGEEKSKRMGKSKSSPYFNNQSGKFWNGNQPLRQREHPATYATTMKIMGRDLRVAILNADEQVKWEKEITKERQRLSTENQIDILEKYEIQKRKPCALCDKVFSTINLPMSISYKAIIDLRTTWGINLRPNSNRARVPLCYDQVLVCHFCAQFFDSADKYRPLHVTEKDPDVMLIEFQKSIEHLDPRDESAFFRKP